jgi:Protein of unknown function (DUF2950)
VEPEYLTVPVVVAPVREIVQAVELARVDQAVVAAVLELVQAAETERAPCPRRDPPEAVRIASVIKASAAAAAVPVSAVEAVSVQVTVPVVVAAAVLAVAAGVVPRAQVVVAAEVAWAAAASAAADAEAVEEAVAVEGAGDKRNLDEEKQMKPQSNIMTSAKILVSIVTFGCLTVALHAAPATKPETGASTMAAKQKQFDDPKQAVDSVVQAAEAFDVPALQEILGPDGKDLVTSEDPVMDKQRAAAFAAKAKEKNSVAIDKKNPNRAVVTVGKDDFELPIPLVKNKGKWSFDTKVGREEILNRRVGENELDAITICRGFVEAQHEYAAEKHDDSKVNQYAQRIISTPGKHDGLAWQTADGKWEGPVGEAIARALDQGDAKQGKPFHGYYFKVLKGQGPAAPMGQLDFVINGAMIGGFAVVAAPAQHRVTGVQTFMVGPDGVVYEKDLGPETLKACEGMDRYNPDKTWKPTDDQWPEGVDAPSAE